MMRVLSVEKAVHHRKEWWERYAGSKPDVLSHWVKKPKDISRYLKALVA